MHGLLPIFGLVAAALASKTLKYAVPIEMQQAVAASGCTLPGEFIITDYSMFNNVNNTALDVLSFNLDDDDTGIKTFCKRDASSQPSNAGSGTATRWPCDNPVVEFITQDNLLTIVEKACPEQTPSSGLEASGSITVQAECQDTQTTHDCTFKQGQSQTGTYASLSKSPSIPPNEK